MGRQFNSRMSKKKSRPPFLCAFLGRHQDGIHQRYVRRVKLQGVAWILSTRGSLFIGIAIAVQSLVMGLELQLELQANATLREQGGPAFYILVVVDCILLLIFCVEYILRARVLKRRYLCSFSGLLDLVLVLSAFGYISVIQLSALQPDDTMKGVVRAVRLLRILRVVHLLQIMPALALLVKGLVSTIITIMDAMILLAIISYIGWKRIHETSKLDTEGQSLITSCVLRNCHGYD